MKKEESELREEIFVLIWAVRTESWIEMALSVMDLINVAMKY
jgi:hypothetical protein